jgi:hypothetical protein
MKERARHMVKYRFSKLRSCGITSAKKQDLFFHNIETKSVADAEKKDEWQ